MNKTVTFLVAVLVGAVGWIFVLNFRVRGLDDLRIEPRPAATSISAGAPGESLAQRLWKRVSQPFDAVAPRTPVEPDGRVIRIATFNLQLLNERKMQQPQVTDILARIARRFDIIALQEIVADTDDILPRLVELMNQTGPDFDLAIGPRLGPPGQQQQYGFIFNCRSVELDRGELYTVDDRDDLLVREPFVAWFRTVGPAPDQAFTFSLVNVRVEPSRGVQERDTLDDVLLAVRNDGRGEDDVIIAGDLRAAPGELGDLERMAEIAYAVQQVPTTTQGDSAGDNLVLQKTATVEFTGRGGVFDFLREFNLTLAQALEVSDHLPVWAEFSIYEGGQLGRVARRNPPASGPQPQALAAVFVAADSRVEPPPGTDPGGKTKEICAALSGRRRLPRIRPVAPLLEVLPIGRRRLGSLLQPGLGLGHRLLFPLQGQLAGQHGAAQEHEVGVEHVATAVVVDLLPVDPGRTGPAP